MNLNLAAAAVVVTSFNSPSGTMIVGLKAPTETGWYVSTSPKEWEFDVVGESVPLFASVEFKPELPGFVLETQGKKAKVPFKYKMRAFYCNAEYRCRQQLFVGEAK